VLNTVRTVQEPHEAGCKAQDNRDVLVMVTSAELGGDCDLGGLLSESIGRTDN